MTLETTRIVLHEDRNVTLTVMLQAVGGEFDKIEKRPAILILPGGAYSWCCDKEAEPVAYPYLAAGYHAFVLRYSVDQHRAWPNPLNDYEEAMELIRSKAEEWHLLPDKMAVAGFSAGGHLAACAATVARNKPNAAILGYAAVSREMTAAMHQQPPAVTPMEAVDEHTCPCFLFAARDDSLVPVENTVDFERALIRHGVSFESHIYAYGGHGFSTCDPSVRTDPFCSRTPHWVADSIRWLGDVFGVLSLGGMGAPACAPRVNGDCEPYLSCACTIGHLMGHKGAAPVLAPLWAALEQKMPKGGDGSAEVFQRMIAPMPLRDGMTRMGCSREQIDALDAQLRQIPN